MIISDLNLLEIEVWDENNLLYTGNCNEIPEKYKKSQIEVIKMDGKKLKLKLIKEV